MNLEELRQKIDKIDEEMIRLFEKRMDIAGEIAQFKKDSNLPVLSASREREKLAVVTAEARDDMKSYISVLYPLLFELSRSYQNKLLDKKSTLNKKISDAVENTPHLFPQSAMVACQGVEGAYSQIAAEKMFKAPNIMYFKNWEGVFSSIANGLCRYGIIPLENSTAGSVKQVYDLMIKYDFSIVRSVRVKIDHNLLAKQGSSLSDIKEIFSHEQAINQCSDFLASLKDVKITCCENTAAAAKMVAESDRTDVAALSSRSCAELYDLKMLAPSVQNQGNNYTRFICISKNLEIYPGADKTSIMMVLSHKPGALYKVLARFYALGINLIKLESRPMPDRDFEFMFYFDLETSIYSEEYVQLIAELDGLCEEFKYLGSYLEVL